jgi:hypothetical protein
LHPYKRNARGRRKAAPTKARRETQEIRPLRKAATTPPEPI